MGMQMVERKISCLDLKGQHQQIREEVFAAFVRVYDQTAFSGGSFVEEFETAFARFCQTRFAVGVNNGTSALHLAMLALGIGPGDEVIVPANTFIATAWGVSYSGATPVFVDCDPETWEIDPEQIERSITSRTKAVIGVHLYGQPFEIEHVSAICKAHSLALVEDAAQAHGATYGGAPVGGFGDLACFSFYPGKNLGACGEGGGITTNSEEYCTRLQRLRNHGSAVRYYHYDLGFNMRMGGFVAASMCVKLNFLPKWNQLRQGIARRYQSSLRNEKVQFQSQPAGLESVYHLFVVTTNDRDDLVRHLNQHQIYPGLHYPVPCHLQKAYAHLGYKVGSLPAAEYLASHCLSLPMYAEMTDEDVNQVIQVINGY
jgi:dTDP-4-amino-4,6-dideoxygalactose transaminase